MTAPSAPRAAQQPRVLVTETLADDAERWLAQHAEVIRCPLEDTARLHRELATAEALIVRTYTRVDDALLDGAPQLRVVARAGVGLDNIDLDACRHRGVRVVHTPDANTQAVVEYVLALIFDQLRPRTDLPPNATAEAFHELRKTEVGQQLDGLTLGIVGLGRVGSRVARAAHALNVKLLVAELIPEAELRARHPDAPWHYLPHHELYAQSDIVTIHVDGRASNRNLVDAQALAPLKPSALLINTSRGFVIDPAALARWLREHRDARAILDVHEPEPPPADYPLWQVPNARLLPHLASRTHEALANMSWVVQDVAAVLAGREPRHPAV